MKKQDKKEVFVIPSSYKSYNEKNNANFETIFNAILAPSSFFEFLDKEYFKDEVCKKEIENNVQKYLCYIDKISQLKNINLVFANGLTLVLTSSDLCQPKKGEEFCNFLIENHKNVSHWILGVPILENFHIIFEAENKLIRFYGIEKKFNSNFETEANESSVGKFFLWLLVICVCIALGFFFTIYLLRQKNKNRKLIEEQIYKTFE